MSAQADVKVCLGFLFAFGVAMGNRKNKSRHENYRQQHEEEALAARYENEAMRPSGAPPVGVLVVKQTKDMGELGSTGLSRWGGTVTEEFLNKLQGTKAYKAYTEMRYNDPVVAAMLRCITWIGRSVDWSVTGENEKQAEFVEQCMDDMCYDSDTEIMTRRGWVHFSDLSSSDEVAQRGDDDVIEYVKPTKIHTYDYDGTLLGYKGSSVDFLVTPNHRCLFAPKVGRKFDNGQKHNLQIYKAEDIWGKRGWMTKAVQWQGNKVKWGADWLEFLGFAVADGYASDRAVTLIQKQPEYVENLLGRLGLTEKAKRRQVNGSTQWTIHDTKLADVLHEFGPTATKKRLPEWLRMADAQSMLAFIDGFGHGDGSFRNGKLYMLHTASKQLADDLQELAMKAGLVANVITRPRSPHSFKPDGAPVYLVSLMTRSERSKYPDLRQGRGWYRQQYQGKVYCVTVPSGIVLVRRNGRYLWCGNSHSWDDFISEAFTMLAYGWSYAEIVPKWRKGKEREPISKYDDGKIGWRKLAFRAQNTLSEWVFDDDGGIQGMVQSVSGKPPVTIPITKALLFRTTAEKGNPEGESILRAAYLPWYYKKNLEEIEGIGIERNMNGLPVIYLGDGTTKTGSNSDYAKAKDLVRDIRKDEQMGAVIPGPKMTADGRGWLLELLSGGSTESMDVGAVIARYEKRIAMSMLAQWLMLGMDQVGSYSLSKDQSDFFRQAVEAVLRMISSVLNRFAIPRLFALNPELERLSDELPTIEYSLPIQPDFGEFAQAVNALVSAQVIDPQEEGLRNTVRSVLGLPEEEVLPEPEETPQPEQMMQAMAAQNQPPQNQQPQNPAQPEQPPKPMPPEMVEQQGKLQAAAQAMKGGPNSGWYAENGHVPGSQGGDGTGSDDNATSQLEQSAFVTAKERGAEPNPNGEHATFTPENGGTLFHGTSSPKFIKPDPGLFYLTDDYKEAEGYAMGVHLGGRGGKVTVVKVMQAKPGKCMDATKYINRGIENDEDPDDLVNSASQAAKGAGARYLSYYHPSNLPDVDREQRVIVSLYPQEDVKSVGGWGVGLAKAESAWQLITDAEWDEAGKLAEQDIEKLTPKKRGRKANAKSV
jgi:hypothetical protein